MSMRVVSRGQKRFSRSTLDTSARLRRAWAPTVEAMEQRQLLTAVVAPFDPRIDGTNLTAPVPAMPGHTFFVDGAAVGTPVGIALGADNDERQLP